MDCDGEAVDASYCIGNHFRKNHCHPTWSEWFTQKDCNVSGCNLIGKRVRKRVCMFKNGSETNNIHLCSSDSIQSDIMTEQCDLADLPIKCQPHWNKWSEAGPCVVFGCNTSGQQTTRRNCLYRNGTEALNVQMCSNQSAIKMIQCSGNNNCEIDAKYSLFSIPAVVIVLILLGVLLGRKHLRHLSSKQNKKKASPEHNRQIKEDPFYYEIHDSDFTVETQEKRSQNINVKTVSRDSKKSNRVPDSNDKINAEQIALLPTIDTSKTLSQSNQSKTKFASYCSAEDIPAAVNYTSTTNFLDEVATNPQTENYDVMKRI